MKFTMQATKIEAQKKGCLMVGVFANGTLTQAAAKLDKLSHGHIKQLIKQGRFEGKPGNTALLHHLPHATVEQVLLVGCGEEKKLSIRTFRKIIASSFKAIQAAKIHSAICYLTELEVEGRHLPWKIKHIAEIANDTSYYFDQFKSEKRKFYLQNITLDLPAKSNNKVNENALKQGLAIAHAVTYTKNIANLPSNICTPAYIAAAAKKFSKTYKSVKVDILEEKQMKKLGMGALLAVAQGSAEKPRLICLHYRGASKNQAPFVFVGKGITFDTGGISLKPAESMVGMKYDMCGAATVLGVIQAAAELQLPLNVIGVIASAENMPSGTATKPEDIVTTLSGQTVEILNTDAEGRLVLCDALTYCERFKPQAVIDIATLTGAVIIALGSHASALLSNNEDLALELRQAGEDSFDRTWPLPLWDEYQEQLRSPFADMANVGGRSAGTITAACFLSRFAKKFHWAHLDVAGTAAVMAGNMDRMASGRPVPMLVQYLLNKVNK